MASLCLYILGRRCLELSAEDLIPEATANAESVVKVSEVVLKVVLLELFIEGWKAITLARLGSSKARGYSLAVMDEVVSHVVA